MLPDLWSPTLLVSFMSLQSTTSPPILHRATYFTQLLLLYLFFKCHSSLRLCSRSLSISPILWLPPLLTCWWLLIYIFQPASYLGSSPTYILACRHLKHNTFKTEYIILPILESKSLHHVHSYFIDRNSFLHIPKPEPEESVGPLPLISGALSITKQV